jgi:hypothetical protein
VTRCAPARSFAAACLVVTLAVSVAACGADGGGEDGDVLGTRNVPVTTSTVAEDTATTYVVSEPPSPSPTAPAAAADLGNAMADELSSIDSQLAELDAALEEFDQMTATTEGDPSK